MTLFHARHTTLVHGISGRVGTQACISGRAHRPAPRTVYGGSSPHARTQIGRRVVCKHVFRLRYPVSASTLNRFICAKKNNLERYAEDPGSHRIDTSKSLYVIAWWLNYAKKTCEKLPDHDELVTPRRHMVR